MEKSFITFLKLAAFLFTVPFLIIWGAYLLTGCAFNAQEVFNNGFFWTLSVVFWVVSWGATAAYLED